MPVRRVAVALLFLLGAASCDEVGSNDGNAGVITAENAGALLLDGALAEGAVGDYFLRNDRLIAIIERPGRVFSLTPYGGNVIDVAPVDSRLDVLGEAMPFWNFGMTANFTKVTVNNDGSDGGPAVIEATGISDIWDFLNIQSLLPALLRYETDDRGRPLGLMKFDPRAALPLQVRATYTLAPDADVIETRYYLRNVGESDLDLRVGFGLDIRGEVEAFGVGNGFIDPSADINDIASLLTGEVDSPFLAYQADGHAIGIESRDFLDGEHVPRMSVGLVGVALILLGAANFVDLLDTPAMFAIAPGEERGFGFDMFLGRDVGDVRAWAEWSANAPPWGRVAGVVREAGGEPIADARIAAIDPATGDVLSAFVSDTSGTYSGSLPAGDYHLVADDLRRPPDAGRLITVRSDRATVTDIELQSSATVQVAVSLADDPFAPTLAPGPCRVLLIGSAPARNGGICEVTRTCAGRAPFRHSRRWENHAPIPYIEYLVTCDTTSPPDAPLEVVPGRYLAVVSRGPEYDTLERLIDVAPGDSTTVRGTIHRVVDSDGWAASEFHVHQVRSPDSLVALSTRTESFAASGIDFFVTTDHDVVTDLRPYIIALGLDKELWSVPGVEVSTIDIGHFNGFPIEPVPGAQYGAPPDWAGGWARPSPGELFDRIRDRGAQIVQVNHARMNGSYFARLLPQYDFDAGTITAAPADGLDAELMLMNPSQPLLATNFDALEIHNSTRDDERVIRDWFNLLSMGVTPTGTAVSDTHSAYGQSPGEPRTYVRVTYDRPLPINPDDLLGNLGAGHAFGSNAPVMRVTVHARGASAGFGDLLTPGDGDLEIEVEVETPDWYQVSVVEFLFTRVYADPVAAADSEGEPIADITESLTPVRVERPNGGVALRYDGRFAYSAAVVSAILGGGSNDGWLVVQVRGPGESLYPVTLLSGRVTLNPSATRASDFAQFVGGQQPWAFGNPIFLDRDGNGRYDAPYPLR